MFITSFADISFTLTPRSCMNLSLLLMQMNFLTLIMALLTLLALYAQVCWQFPFHLSSMSLTSERSWTCIWISCICSSLWPSWNPGYAVLLMLLKLRRKLVILLRSFDSSVSLRIVVKMSLVAPSVPAKNLPPAGEHVWNPLSLLTLWGRRLFPFQHPTMLC